MNIKEAFELYRSLGLKTLPVKQDKSPFVNYNWKEGVNDFSKYHGSYGIGIICGKISGNLECIDFDNHFGDATTIISQFLNSSIPDLYRKYKFPIESTMNGGYHLIFKCNKIDGNQKLAQRPKLDKYTKKFRPDTIIETRGEGGYFVSAPTMDYKWVRNDIKDIPIISSEDRNIIINAAKEYNTWFDLKKNEFEISDKPGDIFNKDSSAINEVKKELLNNNWAEVRDMIWRRPEKKEGISATLGKVADGIFYVFSSNAYPFEPEHAYSPFQVIGLLKYKGDFKRFAADLSKRYDLQKPEKRDFIKPKRKEFTDKEFDEILSKTYIDPSIKVSKPPVIMKIREFDAGRLVDRRLFTFGNFSAITGKSKSKKSFLAAIMLSAACKNGIIDNKIIASLPENKLNVILFDTEQSRYDSFRYACNVMEKAGFNYPNFGAFDLREFSPYERCDIINYALNKFKDTLGYVVIDGIADLVNAINDEDEATRVTTLLMKWTKEFNCHITVNIHQNKNDNYATGWIGSYILKKAECIISVAKDESNNSRSKVTCLDIRGTSEFKDFDIEITDNGIPIITENLNLSTSYDVQDLPY